MWNPRIATVLKEGMKNVAAGSIERWFTPAFRANNPAVIAHIQKILETTSPEGYSACSAAVRDFDFREQLNNMRTPTLVISGTHDPATTPADGRFLANHIAGARYVELNGAHLSNIEDAAHFTQEVSTFLNS
jgi:3-oxoadipate enol-lactonase